MCWPLRVLLLLLCYEVDCILFDFKFSLCMPAMVFGLGCKKSLSTTYFVALPPRCSLGVGMKYGHCIQYLTTVEEQ